MPYSWLCPSATCRERAASLLLLQFFCLTWMAAPAANLSPPHMAPPSRKVGPWAAGQVKAVGRPGWGPRCCQGIGGMYCPGQVRREEPHTGLVTPPQGLEQCQVGILKGDTSYPSPMSIVNRDWELSGQGMVGSCVWRVPAPYTANIPEEIRTRWRSSQYL